MYNVATENRLEPEVPDFDLALAISFQILINRTCANQHRQPEQNIIGRPELVNRLGSGKYDDASKQCGQSRW